jgi:two-component system, NtrC family, response regulator PilR
LKYLQTYSFPGNVRELENILERSMAFSNGAVINVEDLGLRPAITDATENERANEDAAGEASGAAASARPAGATPRLVRLSDDGIPESLPDYLDQIERQAISRALEKTRYNRTAAAKLLGITFRALRYRMQRLGLN